MTKSTREVFLEMCVGLLVYEIILGVVLWLVAGSIGYTRSSLIIGVLIGTIVAVAMMLDMACSTEDAVASKDEKYAKNKVMMHSFFRKIGLIAVVLIFWNIHAVNVIAIVLAPLGIKLGAYMQPVIHKRKGAKEE